MLQLVCGIYPHFKHAYEQCTLIEQSPQEYWAVFQELVPLMGSSLVNHSYLHGSDPLDRTY